MRWSSGRRRLSLRRSGLIVTALTRVIDRVHLQAEAFSVLLLRLREKSARVSREGDE